MIPPAALLPVQRAVCAIVAGPVRSTGWLASAKGLVVTSHRALGYQVEVDIESDQGERRPGRVVAADVARDLAFVLAESGLPRGSEVMAPLPLRDLPAPKLGERVFSTAVIPGRGLRIAPATICAVLRTGTGAVELLDLDLAALGPAGGPLVDHDGRALGVVLRGGAGGEPAGPRRSFALPSVELRAALRPLEAASDLARRAPIYRCPTCGAPFVAEHDACLSCGSALPHPFPPDPARASAERAVRDALAAIGVVANRARIGARTWHLPARGGSDGVPVVLALDRSGGTAAFRAPVAVLPRAARESLYRLLLTLNDQTTGSFRLAVEGEHVLLVHAVPLAMLRDREVAPTLATLSEMAEHYRKILHEGYDAAPLASLDLPADQIWT